MRLFHTETAVLTPRQRVWAGLCFDQRNEHRSVSVDWFDYEFSYDTDSRVFLAELERLGSVTTSAAGFVSLTTAGQAMCRETLLTGRVPTPVWLDPTDWRHRAWTAIRVHCRFSLGALLASGVDVEEARLGAYLEELAELEHVVRLRQREEWLLVNDPGPVAPRLIPAHPGERTASRPWRSRLRLAAARLGCAGGGFTAVDLEQATGVDGKLAFQMLKHWETLGHVVAIERMPLRGGVPGRAWWWSLAHPRSLDSAPEVGGPAGERQELWDRLSAGERLRESDVAEITGSRLRGPKYVRQLVAAGLVQTTRGGLHKAPKAPASPYPKGASHLRAVR